jgi:aspartyl-tRNA(Asn)/glutamyl-tRNA(Gln) amidotransferase subunit B
MRTKEQLNDYRYFPEPDIAPVSVTVELKERIKADLPVLPSEAYSKLIEEHGLDRKDAMVISEELSLYLFFEATVSKCQDPVQVKNWIVGPIKGILNDRKMSIDDSGVEPSDLAELILMIRKKELSSTAGQKILSALFDETDALSVRELASKMNLLQERNVYEIVPVIEEVLAENEPKVKEYQNGKKGLVGMFMGQIMKKTSGKIDPQLTNKLLVEKLNTYKK